MLNEKKHIRPLFLQVGILLFGFVFSIHCFSQRYSNIHKVLANIKSVPAWYANTKQQPIKKDFSKVDSAYREIVRLDTNAIIKLMDVLSDTMATTIINPCGCGYFTYSQLAYFLINDIEAIPLEKVLDVKWLATDNCNTLPYGFLNYLKDNGKKFESKYREYFNSNQRVSFLKNKSRFN